MSLHLHSVGVPEVLRQEFRAVQVLNLLLANGFSIITAQSISFCAELYALLNCH